MCKIIKVHNPPKWLPYAKIRTNFVNGLTAFPMKRILTGTLAVILFALPLVFSCGGGSRSPGQLTYTDTVTVFRDSVIIHDSIILRELKQPKKEASFIVVDKDRLMLTLYDATGGVIFRFPCCCGKELGNKDQRYDGRTPEGVFKVSMIQDSRLWKHDSHDGRGPRLGCYGPYFIRLDYPPYHKIGIHGTDEPESLGTRASEGCIRIENGNLEKLVPYVYNGMPVIITPSYGDMEVNHKKA